MGVETLRAGAARLFGRDPDRDAARRLYAAATLQAREPVFYRDYGVPDTVEGRFDLLGLHVFALLRRLRAEGEERRALAQRLFDVMFEDVEDNLREMGVGDLKVGKKVRQMAEVFYGRSGAYEAALRDDADLGALPAAIGRNVFGNEGGAGADRLARYLRAAEASLAAAPLPALTRGEAAFPDPRSIPEETAHVVA